MNWPAWQSNYINAHQTLHSCPSKNAKTIIHTSWTQFTTRTLFSEICHALIVATVELIVQHILRIAIMLLQLDVLHRLIRLRNHSSLIDLPGAARIHRISYFHAQVFIKQTVVCVHGKEHQGMLHPSLHPAEQLELRRTMWKHGRVPDTGERIPTIQPQALTIHDSGTNPHSMLHAHALVTA